MITYIIQWFHIHSSIHALRHRTTRSAAVKQLIQAGQRASRPVARMVSRLVRRTECRDWTSEENMTYTAALEALAEIRGPAAFAAVVRCLDDFREWRRNAALSTLVKFGDCAIDVLLGTPTHKIERSEAIKLVGLIQSKQALRRLMALFEESPSDDVAVAIAGILRAEKDYEMLKWSRERLVRMLDANADNEFTGVILRPLCEVLDATALSQISRYINHKRHRLAINVSRSIGANLRMLDISHYVTPIMTMLWSLKRDFPPMRSEIMRYSMFASDTTLALESWSSNKDVSDVQYWRNFADIAQCLGNMCIPDLVHHLDDEDTRAVDLAVYVLERGGWQPSTDAEAVASAIAKQEYDNAAQFGELAVKPLLRRVCGDRWQTSRIVFYIGQINGDQATEALLYILEHRDVEEYSQAWAGLGRRRNTRVLDALLKSLLSCPSAGVCEGLANYADEKSLPALFEAYCRLLRQEYGILKQHRVDACKCALLSFPPDSGSLLIPYLCEGTPGQQRDVAQILKQMKWVPRNDVERAYLAVALAQWQDVATMGRCVINPLQSQMYLGYATAESIRLFARLGGAESVPKLLQLYRSAATFEQVGDGCYWNPNDELLSVILNSLSCIADPSVADIYKSDLEEHADPRLDNGSAHRLREMMTRKISEYGRT